MLQLMRGKDERIDLGVEIAQTIDTIAQAAKAFDPVAVALKLKFEKKEILYVNFVDTTKFVFMLNLVPNITFKYHQIVIRV